MRAPIPTGSRDVSVLRLSCYVFVLRRRATSSCYVFVLRLRPTLSCYVFVLRLCATPFCCHGYLCQYILISVILPSFVSQNIAPRASTHSPVRRRRYVQRNSVA